MKRKKEKDKKVRTEKRKYKRKIQKTNSYEKKED